MSVITVWLGLFYFAHFELTFEEIDATKLGFLKHKLGLTRHLVTL